MSRGRGVQADPEVEKSVDDYYNSDPEGGDEDTEGREEENGQQKLIPTDAIDDCANALLASTIGQQYEFKAVVVLKSTRDNSQPITLPIGRGKVLGKFIHEMLEALITNEDFTNRLAACVGKRSGELGVKLEEREKEKALELAKKGETKVQ